MVHLTPGDVNISDRTIENSLMSHPFRPRLSDDQKFTQHFAQTTHSMIPVYKRDLTKMKIPLSAVVVPFPKDVGAPPLLPHRVSKCAVCKKCKAFASARSVPCPDGSGWLCGFCEHKNPFVSGSQEYFAAQHQSSVWDVDVNTDGGGVTQDPFYHLLVIELSEASVNNGLFNFVIESLEKKVETLDSGRFCVCVFNRGIQFPVVTSDGKRYSMATMIDLEDSCFPSPDTMFFDLEDGKETFLAYLNYLKTLKSGPPSAGVLQLVKAFNDFAVSEKIPVVLVTCQANIEPIEKFREYASTMAFKAQCNLEIWTVKPEMYQPDYSGLSELAIFVNAKVHLCDPVQMNVLPGEIVKSLFDPKFTDVVIFSVMSPCFKVKEIFGAGYWRSEQAFTVPALGANDSVYFVLDYDVSQVKTAAPGIQFQVRYFDQEGRRVLRVISTWFSIVDNMNTCAMHAYYDVVAATLMHQALDKIREFGSMEAFRAKLEELKKGYIEDTFAKLFLMNTDAVSFQRVTNCLTYGGSLVDKVALPSIFGRCPSDVSLFLSPVCYAFNLYSNTMGEPFTANVRPIQGGAYYVKLPDRHGVILLAPTEDVGLWSQAISEPPLSELMASVCQETIVEILSPTTSATHPLFVHLNKCFRP